MTLTQSLWLPVDFYFSVSRTNKRTLHVPQRVVDVWAESRGVEQRSLVLNVRVILEIVLIVDLERRQRNYNPKHAKPSSYKGWPPAIPRS